VLELHPDKQHTQNDADKNIKFHEAQLAWEVLRDPIKRSQYDKMIDGKQLSLFYICKKIPH
jgi:DnaJ-class molecular chaperone